MQHMVPLRGEEYTLTMDKITPLHGAGGEMMGKLLRERILVHFPDCHAGRIGLTELDDGATIDLPAGGEAVITTDSHVVKPIFFPGGDIGRLAAAGTLNDLAVMGEEGFPLDSLDRILASFSATLAEAGAVLIAGDTKVMGHGEIDGIAINTTGIGIADRAVSDAAIEPGDRIIITGTIGDHGMALLASREEFNLDARLVSDVAPIWPMISQALSIGGIKAMKDPTRGGLAAALNEMASKSMATIEIDEEKIPLRREVIGLSELLGISPLEVANEGKAILIVEQDRAEEILARIRAHRLGENAAITGRVTDEYPGRVILATEVGGRRFLDMPLGDPVPRIC